MVLDARSADLGVTVEGDDIVAEGVLLAVMLVKTAVRRAIDEVVFGKNVRRSLVEIDAPPAVLQGAHIVETVEANDRAFLVPERIDAGHVAEKRLRAVGFHADVVDVIVLDDIPLGRRLRVTPSPTAGNRRVPEAMDVVVGNGVVVRLADPDRHATGE